jgi:hypothetical protein
MGMVTMIEEKVIINAGSQMINLPDEPIEIPAPKELYVVETKMNIEGHPFELEFLKKRVAELEEENRILKILYKQLADQ